MKVKINNLSASPMGVLLAGQVYDIDDEIAQGLINGGYAESVDQVIEKKQEEKKETATEKTKIVKRKAS